jgi:hypothetical protein
VFNWFCPMGMKITKYTNPADKLSIIASAPKYALNQEATITDLAKKAKEGQKINMVLSSEEERKWNSLLSSGFTEIAATREVSQFKQYYLLLGRFMLYTWRAPISIVFLFFLAFFTAFLQASIFHGVGAQKFNLDPVNDF